MRPDRLTVYVTGRSRNVFSSLGNSMIATIGPMIAQKNSTKILPPSCLLTLLQHCSVRDKGKRMIAMKRRVHVSNSTQQEDEARFEARLRRLERAFEDHGVFGYWDFDADDAEHDHEYEAGRDHGGSWLSRRRPSSEKRSIISKGISVFAALLSPLHLLVSVIQLAPQPLPTSTRKTH